MSFIIPLQLSNPDLFPAVFTEYFGDEDKFTLLSLHGSMEQKDRVPVYNKFNSCAEGVLFTTDVAARGLDVPVSLVLSYCHVTSSHCHVTSSNW